MRKNTLVQIVRRSILASIAYRAKRKNQRRRRFWVRELFANREIDGMFETTFGVLERDPEMFFKAVRMSIGSFMSLLNVLIGSLAKSSIRRPISAKCRLFLTLLYLAHGGERRIYSLSFRIATCTIGKIIMETCETIWVQLYPIYLPVPTGDDWIIISQIIESKCRVPNCVGAIDGKHVTITCPPNAGSQFFNYKKRHSIILLALCDAQYRFILVDVGAYGSQSDGGVFKNSRFGIALEQSQLFIPGPRTLPNSATTFPYFIVGDAAFPLKKYLMRPFPGKNLPPERQNFNKCISRCRVFAENTFGVLTTRWRVLRNDINCVPKNAENIVKATLVLHNFLRNADNLYCPPNFTDRFIGERTIRGQWREDNFQLESLTGTAPNNASRESFALRNLLCNYLNNR